jgi:hypothetical protein
MALHETLPAAETDLKSGSRAAQARAIAALPGLMMASPATQPAVLKSLASFIRSESPSGNNDHPVTSIVQAALNVLRARNPARDAGSLIDLDNANLTSANLTGINLNGASLMNADFSGANLGGASLRGTILNYAFLGNASLDGADLAGANLVNASFYQTLLCHGSAPTQPKMGYNCSADG